MFDSVIKPLLKHMYLILDGSQYINFLRNLCKISTNICIIPEYITYVDISDLVATDKHCRKRLGKTLEEIKY